MENITVKIGYEPHAVVGGQRLGLPARLDMTWRKLREARSAGKWGGFGMAVGAVLAFQTVIMSWYGVNFILGGFGFSTQRSSAAFCRWTKILCLKLRIFVSNADRA